MMHFAGYYPPRPTSEPAPIRLEICFEPADVDRKRPIPQWPYKVEVTYPDGSTRARGGSVEAVTEEQAANRVYGKAVDFLAEQLAGFAAKTGGPP